MHRGARAIIAGLLSAGLTTSAIAQVAPLPLPPPVQAKPASELPAAPLPPLLPASAAPAALPTSPTSIQAPPAIEAIPQVATPAPQSPLLYGLYMPGIAEALLGDKANTLPDYREVRRYVFSVFAGFAGACGPLGDNVAINAMGYVEPGLGAGRDAAEVGLQKGMQFLMNLAQAQKTGDITSFARSMTADSYKVQEGESDGAMLASRLGCNSQNYNALVSTIDRLMRTKNGVNPQPLDGVILASLMSPEYRQKNNIEDPAITLKKRRIAQATSNAQKLCASSYDSSTFCGCLFGRLGTHDLSESDWDAMSKRFTSIVNVAAQKPDVAQSIRSCNRGS